MIKTAKQQMIEAQHKGKDWRDVVKASLESHRGKYNIVILVAAQLGVSNQTIYNWCKDLEINLDDYRNSGARSQKPSTPRVQPRGIFGALRRK